MFRQKPRWCFAVESVGADGEVFLPSAAALSAPVAEAGEKYIHFNQEGDVLFKAFDYFTELNL